MVGTSSAPVGHRGMLLRKLGIKAPGPIEGLGHAAADILLSDMLMKFSLIHPLRGLFSGSAKNKLFPGFMHTIGKILDRKSTRLNSSHQIISYAVFCLKKKKPFSDQLC